MYTWVFAENDTHIPITSLEQLRKMKTWNVYLGLHWKGQGIGSGSLCKVNWSKKYLHTDDVSLKKKFRNKGHGVHLYMALIECARYLGVKRLYSSRSLNKFSRRMWKEKLPALGFQVVLVNKCSHACEHCLQQTQFYIDL